jgi:polysaccharide biosynthesis/export protein
MTGKITRLYFGSLVFFAASLAIGQTGAPQSSEPAAEGTVAKKADDGFATRNPRYQIGLGDVLELSFPFVPEMNQTITVLPDGFVTLKEVGDLQAKGLTVPQLSEALRGRYAKILHDPVISVVLKDYEKPYFVVSGKVSKPGKYDLRGDTTVTQAVAIAGGFDDAAKHSQVLLLRRAPNDWVEVKSLNIKEMMRTGNLKEDLHLRNGDMLFIPKSTISKIKPWIPGTSLGMFMNSF